MYRYIVLMIVFFPLAAMGQNNSLQEKPFWADGYFKELNNSYIEVVSAFGYDLASAKEKAAKEVIRRRSLATGTEANVRIDGNNNLTVLSEHNLIVKARVVDEYALHTTGGYTVYLLVQTAKNPTYQYEPVSISDEYSVGAKAFVPGMAQIYKGSKTKGYSIIAAEALSIAGIVFCDNQRTSYVKKAKEQPKFVKDYTTKADNWETGRNVCIGVAAGIWIYNIIDAYVAKGKKRVVVNRADGNGLSIVPGVSSEGAGVSFAYKF